MARHFAINLHEIYSFSLWIRIPAAPSSRNSRGVGIVGGFFFLLTKQLSDAESSLAAQWASPPFSGHEKSFS